MNFDFRLFFTGICAFVPNRPLSQQPNKMRVVLLDGRFDNKKAADNEELVPHFAALVIHTKYLRQDVRFPPDGELVWYLNHETVKLQTSGDVDALKVVSGAGNDSFSLVADLAQIAPEFSEMDQAHLATPPRSRDVVAQMTLDKGTLSVHDPDKDQIWQVHHPVISPDPGKPYKQVLANRAVLQLNVPDIKIVVEPFQGAGLRELSLSPSIDGDQVVEATLVNLCDGKLLRPRKPLGGPSSEDDDFRWFYELSSKISVLRTRMNHVHPKKLPIPEPTTAGGGKPIQCMLAMFKDDASIS